MRLAQIATPDGFRTHLRVADGGYIDVAAATGDPGYITLEGIISGGPRAVDALASLVDRDGTAFDPDRFGPAVPTPRRVLCLGRNYREHALEVGDLDGRDVPAWPETFVRGSDSVLGPYAPIVRPGLTDGLDFEGELGVLLKSGGRYVRANDAADTIFGYVVLNDVTARDWQRAGMQWTPGKNFDASMPLGPELVTADELDVSDLALTTILNGRVMQAARTSQMLVSVDESIEFFSSFTTLRGGDLIATGTPGGVGFARKPPVWLTGGDVIEVSIEGIGTIRNEVVDETAAPTDWPWTPALAQR
jgi:2-keto-4-pentenoate hydratase/2-oxohepta-3-ene-1,7-dioic acid hydratase in catechol pathway